MDDKLKQKKDEKLKVAKQKIFRSTFIDNMPDELRNDFENFEFFCGSSRDSIIERLRDVSLICSGKANNWSFDIKEFDTNNFYMEFGWNHKAIRVIGLNDNLMDEDISCYLYFGYECPLFAITYGWFKDNYKRLLDDGHDVRDFTLVSFNFDSGLSLSSFGGYVEGDYNPSETGYQLEIWSLSKVSGSYVC